MQLLERDTIFVEDDNFNRLGLTNVNNIGNSSTSPSSSSSSSSSAVTSQKRVNLCDSSDLNPNRNKFNYEYFQHLTSSIGKKRTMEDLASADINTGTLKKESVG